jgi:hypothetical protein
MIVWRYGFRIRNIWRFESGLYYLRKNHGKGMVLRPLWGSTASKAGRGVSHDWDMSFVGQKTFVDVQILLVLLQHNL